MKKLHEFLNNWPRTLFFIFIIALLIRGAFIVTLQDGFYFPDSISYTRAAGNLLNSDEFGKTYGRAPGYPAYLATIYALFNRSIFTIRLVESALGALLAVLIAVLGRRVGGVAVGVLAGGLWSIYPLGVFIVGLVYPQGLMAFLLAAGACCVLPQAGQALSCKRVFLGGLLWGVAALTVPVGLATIAMMSLWLMYWGHSKRFRLVAVLLLGSALTVVPWTIRNYRVHGRLVAVDTRMESHLPRLSGSSVPHERVLAILRRPDLFLANMAAEFVYFWRLYPDRVGMSRPEIRDKYIQRDSRVVRTTIFTRNELMILVSIVSTVPLFLSAAMGTAAMWSRKEYRRDLSMLWTMILSFAIGYSVFFTKLRYRIPIEPYIIILSASGLAHTWRLVSGRHAWKLRNPENINLSQTN
jgi:4-amino-4-deoxy-L-arabinose transferase-like glycosyltransferase